MSSRQRRLANTLRWRGGILSALLRLRGATNLQPSTHHAEGALEASAGSLQLSARKSRPIKCAHWTGSTSAARRIL